jgi:hypothetical protein
MILEEVEVMERVESPLNLLNRLRTQTSKQLVVPSIPPGSAEVINNLDEKLAYGSLKSKAAGIMNEAMNELRNRLPEVQRPEKLAAIAEQMSKVINNAQTRTETDVRVGQIIVYAPQIVTEDRFDVVADIEA